MRRGRAWQLGGFAPGHADVLRQLGPLVPPAVAVVTRIMLPLVKLQRSRRRGVAAAAVHAAAAREAGDGHGFGPGGEEPLDLVFGLVHAGLTRCCSLEC